MKEINRRDSLKTLMMAAAGLSIGQGGPGMEKSEADKKLDRQRVIAAGMTEAEADCWVAVAEAANRFFRLPELHPMDKEEVAQAIHIIQNKLLSRPTYRKYRASTRGEEK